MFPNQWFYRYRSAVDHKSLSFFLEAAMWAVCLLIFLQLSAGAAYASQMASLYDVDILVADESTSLREQAFQQGLDEVFIRIAGDSIVMDKLKRPEPSRYVRQFSYEPVPNPLPDDRGVIMTHHLKIQYNGNLMQKYLLDNGFPVWGEHRPDLVIWLAVRDGTNEYVLKDSDQSKLKAAVDAAMTRRGVPVRWPLYDSADRKILSVADIRGGFKDPVIKASQRYTRGPALTGSMIWNGKEWQSSWSLLLDSGNRHWSLVGPDYSMLLNKVIDQAADALGVVFAITDAINKQKQVMIQLEIQDVNSVEKYHRAESYLSDLSSVSLVRPVKVDAQNVIFELTLRSTEADFLNLIHNDAELVKVKVKQPEIKTEVQPEVKPVPPPDHLTEIKVTADEIGKPAEKDTAVPLAIPPVTAPVEVAPVVEQLPLYHYRFRN
jgi:hypothetical protein